MVFVTAAIIVAEDQVLIARRRTGQRTGPCCKKHL